MKKQPFFGFGVILILISMISLTGCSTGNSLKSQNLSTNTAQKGVCLQMTTFCENDPKTTLQYNYAQIIGDGSGITFGCIGFTTGTYDGNILIHYYTTLNPNNILAKYIPALNRIDSEAQAVGGKSNDTTGLDNFIYDVQHCTDPLFKQAQNYELNQIYWNPAVTLATNIGARYPITLAFIYDMGVNHGIEGAQRFIDQTNSGMGGSPATGVDEKQWLMKCINIRYNSLVIYQGSNSADRCNAFLRVLQSDNVNLTIPFSFTCYGDTCTINGNVGY